MLACSFHGLRNKAIHAAAVLVKALDKQSFAQSSSPGNIWSPDDAVFAAAASAAAANLLQTLQKVRCALQYCALFVLSCHTLKGEDGQEEVRICGEGDAGEVTPHVLLLPPHFCS